MFGIATAGGRRGQTDLNWRLKAAVYCGSALLAGAICGLLLGGLGSLLPEQARTTVAALGGLVLVVAGAAHLRPGSARTMLERDCETSQSWLERGPLAWALMNGAALGSGFLSRIGFVCWYAVPLASFAFGSSVIGALVYGLYAGLRGLGVCVWVRILRGTGLGRNDPDVFLELSGPGKRLSAALLVTLATATIVIVGF